MIIYKAKIKLVETKTKQKNGTIEIINNQITFYMNDNDSFMTFSRVSSTICVLSVSYSRYIGNNNNVERKRGFFYLLI